jgi:hypothetical protein
MSCLTRSGSAKTGDNLLPNAITKLRKALGGEYGPQIENVPRVGYRFAGAFERTAMARLLVSRLQLKPRDAVPRRHGMTLHSRIRNRIMWKASTVASICSSGRRCVPTSAVCHMLRR